MIVKTKLHSSQKFVLLSSVKKVEKLYKLAQSKVLKSWMIKENILFS